MKELECIQDILVDTAYQKMKGGVEKVSSKDLGDAIDMIKDIEKTIYYHHIINAMKRQGLSKVKMEDGYVYYSDKDSSKNLTDYLEEITKDIVEIVHKANPNEKEILHKHISKILDEMK